MRNLTSGNKMNFTIFALIVLIILIILCTAVIMVVRTDKEEYPVSNTMSIYDKDYSNINRSKVSNLADAKLEDNTLKLISYITLLFEPDK